MNYMWQNFQNDFFASLQDREDIHIVTIWGISGIPKPADTIEFIFPKKVSSANCRASVTVEMVKKGTKQKNYSTK